MNMNEQGMHLSFSPALSHHLTILNRQPASALLLPWPSVSARVDPSWSELWFQIRGSSPLIGAIGLPLPPPGSTTKNGAAPACTKQSVFLVPSSPERRFCRGLACMEALNQPGTGPLSPSIITFHVL
jgi:hypothetical protein